MHELDDRLREILGRYGEGFNDRYAGDRTGDYLVKIKQAFANEDWHHLTLQVKDKKAYLYFDGEQIYSMPVHKDGALTGWVKNKKVAASRTDSMTGKDWYERFNKELDKTLATGKSGILQTENTPILEAAKRAAGIEESND